MTRKNIIITLSIVLFSSTWALAQQTKGGSTQDWRRYDIQYDTVYSTVTEQVSLPPSSKSYFRGGLLSGTGLWADDSFVNSANLGFPEDGLAGTDGADMSGGWEVVYGKWNNWENTNKNLHPGIDMSEIVELGVQGYNFEYSGPASEYAHSGAAYSFFFGYGVGVTLKPMVLGGKDATSRDNNKLLVDIGLSFNMHLYGFTDFEYSGTAYDGGGNAFPYTGYNTFDSDPLGARIDYQLQVGVRYGFIGAYFFLSNQLTGLYKPEYESYFNNGYIGPGVEDMNFGLTGFGISLNF